MIIHEKGDLLQYLKNGDVDAIAHCCNDQGVMGSGIALQIKNELPDAFAAYRDYHDQNGLPLGTISHTETVFNLHAQRGYGKGTRHVCYEGLYISLEKTRDVLMATYPFGCVLGVPKYMASALAGGDFRIVEVMLEVIFGSTPIDIVVVEYNK